MQTKTGLKIFTASLMLGAMTFTAQAETFNIPGGDLKAALDMYARQTGAALVYSDEALGQTHTKGVKGDLNSGDALARILSGTGFTAQRYSAGGIGIVPASGAKINAGASLQSDFQLAQATPPPRASVETVTVTSSKLGGADVQSIPISITALSQEQLTATQTAGGPDLVKQVPNLTFTKTNFTGYSIQIRGIGTQAISVTTDPAVAVALNDIPFIRNHFFEQEFYDLGQVEVLRGPQGTLYGRNATAGVVNLTTAKPTDQFEAMASGEIGNYHQHRFEGMINLPIVDDRLDIRLAGEWTKRQGYSFNEDTGQRIDGRDLWSGRVSIAWKPFQNLQTTLVWEHFSEDDDRMRTAKQLCKKDPGPSSVDGVTPPPLGFDNPFTFSTNYLSQGCLPASLYSPESFQVPNGFSLPYVTAASFAGFINERIDPYAEATQSSNLRIIQTVIDPIYKAKNDTIEFNADYAITPALTFTAQTGYSSDFLYSTEDYNRFNTSPDIFIARTDSARAASIIIPDGNYACDDVTISIGGACAAGGGKPTGYFCDPQLGCSNKLVAQDVSDEHAWQLSQEFRIASHFAGPFNFSLGGNYMHYETEENYYVFINALSLFALTEGAFGLNSDPYVPGVTDNHQCLRGGFRYSEPAQGGGIPSESCVYVDPNPLSEVNDNGHNYFLSQNPYTLNSYAAFGEAYYDIFKDVKLTAGLRFTEDQKHFSQMPSWVIANGWGYPVVGVVDQQWDQFTGRFAANWSPHLDFTDQTLIYGSYAHGYKAGGANPPGAVFDLYFTGTGGTIANPIHPLTFKPEFIDAFEVGSKNTLLDGALTLNGSAFYYNYENYQISEIVDRTSINLNFDAHVKGAELEATYEPIPGLRFNFAGGWEESALAKGSKAIDLMDRTAGTPGWMVVKPFATQASNCIFPTSVVAALIVQYANYGEGNQGTAACGFAYNGDLDPVTLQPYSAGTYPMTISKAGFPTITYQGFDPSTAPNDGEGFDKDLSGNQLPNAPEFTVSAGAQYTMPLSSDWAGTLRGDFYWQDASWARIFNDDPYDRIHGYTNLNLALIFTSQNGWQVMLYDKNVFDTTAITGTFLNSDDTGLTTNVFLTDPKLIGIRVTKNW